MQYNKFITFAVALAFVFSSAAIAVEPMGTEDPIVFDQNNLEEGMVGATSFTDMDQSSEDGVRGYYEEGVSEDPGMTIEGEDDRVLGYPLDRHPQLDTWHPPGGHPPYGAAD
jgi:hypothetical protein